MKTFYRYSVFFILGAVGYGAIELLWRGQTHWAMLVAGGICFMIFSHIAEVFSEEHICFKIILCALSVTAVEVIFGVIFNILLKEDIWDYSNLPLNFMGQICLIYSILWGLLGFLVIPLAEKINRKMIPYN